MATNAERARVQAVAKEITKWWSKPRWAHTKRDYTAEDVAKLRPSIQIDYPCNHTANKFYNMMRGNREKGIFSATYGALDPVQVVNQAKHLDSVYVSGWQSSSTASTALSRGPDFADYPSNTVPQKVAQLFQALLFEDRLQNQERAEMTDEELKKTPRHDYLIPLVADGDCGFGGVTSVMKTAKMFAEAGAAGIHIEDQRAGAKKCGHMGGKVIVSMEEWISRLKAARLQFDIMNCDTVLIARTDTFSGRYIDSNFDARDHAFILGQLDPDNDAHLYTFIEAGVEDIKAQLSGSAQANALDKWTKLAPTLSFQNAKKLAQSIGFKFHFDWEAARTSEGFYQMQAGLECALNRIKHMHPYADSIWMETPTPDIETCEKLAAGAKAINPDILLSYNLSPSFNWELYDDQYLKTFNERIGKLGFNWQFITLAGFHMDGLISEIFSREFKKSGMFAYAKEIQAKERVNNVSQLKHQKWSGAALVDQELNVVTGGATSTSSMQDGCTEDQFKADATLMQEEATEQFQAASSN